MTNGRIRIPLQNGLTSLVRNELERLQLAVIRLEAGETCTLDTGEREFACVLVYGECEYVLESGGSGKLGPRLNPFDHPPYGLFASKRERIVFTASAATLIGAGSAPAEKKMKNTLITPKETGGGKRGKDNWEREVRFVCWSDNSEGNLLMAGETVTPSGNWSTIPPHRHQYDIPGEEVPYEELYFFQFSHPQGFGLLWQFDEKTGMDQAFSLRSGDVIAIDGGYHPTVCGPGSKLYHLTFMAGPYRQSKSSVHPDYKFLLEEQNMQNPYAVQTVRKE